MRSGDQRAVARSSVALDTEQHRGPTTRQRRHDRREISAVEDLGDIAAGVLGGELAARAFSDPLAVILGVLKLTQLGGRGEFRVVLVGDPGLGGGRLQPE